MGLCCETAGLPTHSGIEPKVNMLKMALRPTLSDTVAHPIRPPRLPAASPITYLQNQIDCMHGSQQGVTLAGAGVCASVMEAGVARTSQQRRR